MRLYNTLSRRLEELPEGRVRMYVCGPTVYARAHVGNARPYVVGMWLTSWLRAQGRDVTFVHNITDINEKIDVSAAKRGIPSSQLAAQAAEWYLEDTGDLGLGRPDLLPKATESVPQIVHFIEELIARDFAYPVGGDVYFRVARDPEYGQLSRQRPDQVEEQEPNPLKEDPRDFALWKGMEPGEDTAWESPWGAGRPGWHIECSAMAEDAFGPVFEIHGGGIDLVFPHHENELAQSRALGHEFARLWMHNGLLEFTGDKMSKSLGNVVTLREALDEWGRETLLLLFLGSHWRKPMDFSEETLRQAQAQAESFRNALQDRGGGAPDDGWDDFERILADDFNTPAALALLHEWRAGERTVILRRGLDVFGLGSLGRQHTAPGEIEQLAVDRQVARERRDFREADRLRSEIEKLGWQVRDVEGGFRLAPKR